MGGARRLVVQSRESDGHLGISITSGLYHGETKLCRLPFQSTSTMKVARSSAGPRASFSNNKREKPRLYTGRALCDPMTYNIHRRMVPARTETRLGR